MSVFVSPLIVAVVCGFFAGTACATALAMATVGIISDQLHTRKMRRGEASYRLPWYYRWFDWRQGSDSDALRDQGRLFYDKRVGRPICIYASS
jgi:hypothetical protein